ncbi:MAG: DNA recombination protein RmuC, partial [Planctomycetes bacterium]|nr:DNA recombination protein RmuC [Planctomycetota bacterium]
MTVAMGLHGLQIEKQAAEIRQNLKKLNADFDEFHVSWDTLGSHIRKTANKYNETDKNLSKFGDGLSRIQLDQSK